MITDKHLRETGFKIVLASDDCPFFIKGNVKLEKIYKGYLCSDPYMVIKTIKQLDEILRDGTTSN
jgi:hypothetical protein